MKAKTLRLVAMSVLRDVAALNGTEMGGLSHLIATADELEIGNYDEQTVLTAIAIWTGRRPGVQRALLGRMLASMAISFRYTL